MARVEFELVYYNAAVQTISHDNMQTLANVSIETRISLYFIMSNIYDHLRCAFNKFPDFFVQAFKIVVDS